MDTWLKLNSLARLKFNFVLYLVFMSFFPSGLPVTSNEDLILFTITVVELQNFVSHVFQRS